MRRSPQSNLQSERNKLVRIIKNSDIDALKEYIATFPSDWHQQETVHDVWNEKQRTSIPRVCPLLHYAAGVSNFAFFQVLLEETERATVTSRNELLRTVAPTGAQPIHYAAMNEDASVLKFLVEERIDINVLDQSNRTPLMHSIIHQNRPMIDYLLSCPNIDINCQTKKERLTALHLASEKGDLKTLEQLLSRGGADINQQDEYGWTCLHHAVQGKHKEVVDCLLQNGADVTVTNNSDQRAYSLASMRFKRKLGRAMISRLQGQSSEQQQFEAAAKGDLKTLKELLSREGADINRQDANGWTCLHHAARHDRKKVIDYLLRKGADVTVTSNGGGHAYELQSKATFSANPLRRIKEGIHKSLKQVNAFARVLEATRGNNSWWKIPFVDDNDNTSFVEDAILGNNRILLNRIFSLKTPEEVKQYIDRKDLLSMAIRHRRSEIVCYLVECGADVTRMPRFDANYVLNGPYLHLATIAQLSDDALNALINAGADLCAVDDHGHYAHQILLEGGENKIQLRIDRLISLFNEKNYNAIADEYISKNRSWLTLPITEEKDTLSQLAAEADSTELLEAIYNSFPEATRDDDIRELINSQHLLHCAVQTNESESKVGWLLDHGADPCRLVGAAETVLMHAAYFSDSTEVVNLLLDRGARSTLDSVDGGPSFFNTAVEYASRKEHVAVVDLLLRKGAKVRSEASARAAKSKTGIGKVLKEKIESVRKLVEFVQSEPVQSMSQEDLPEELSNDLRAYLRQIPKLATDDAYLKNSVFLDVLRRFSTEELREASNSLSQLVQQIVEQQAAAIEQLKLQIAQTHLQTSIALLNETLRKLDFTNFDLLKTIQVAQQDLPSGSEGGVLEVIQDYVSDTSELDTDSKSKSRQIRIDKLPESVDVISDALGYINLVTKSIQDGKARYEQREQEAVVRRSAAAEARRQQQARREAEKKAAEERAKREAQLAQEQAAQEAARKEEQRKAGAQVPTATRAVPDYLNEDFETSPDRKRERSDSSVSSSSVSSEPAQSNENPRMISDPAQSSRVSRDQEKRPDSNVNNADPAPVKNPQESDDQEKRPNLNANDDTASVYSDSDSDDSTQDPRADFIPEPHSDDEGFIPRRAAAASTVPVQDSGANDDQAQSPGASRDQAQSSQVISDQVQNSRASRDRKRERSDSSVSSSSTSSEPAQKVQNEQTQAAPSPGRQTGGQRKRTDQMTTDDAFARAAEIQRRARERRNAAAEARRQQQAQHSRVSHDQAQSSQVISDPAPNSGVSRDHYPQEHRRKRPDSNGTNKKQKILKATQHVPDVDEPRRAVVEQRSQRVRSSSISSSTSSSSLASSTSDQSKRNSGASHDPAQNPRVSSDPAQSSRVSHDQYPQGHRRKRLDSENNRGALRRDSSVGSTMSDASSSTASSGSSLFGHKPHKRHIRPVVRHSARSSHHDAYYHDNDDYTWSNLGAGQVVKWCNAYREGVIEKLISFIDKHYAPNEAGKPAAESLFVKHGGISLKEEMQLKRLRDWIYKEQEEFARLTNKYDRSGSREDYEDLCEWVNSFKEIFNREKENLYSKGKMNISPREAQRETSQRKQVLQWKVSFTKKYRETFHGYEKGGFLRSIKRFFRSLKLKWKYRKTKRLLDQEYSSPRKLVAALNRVKIAESQQIGDKIICPEKHKSIRELEHLVLKRRRPAARSTSVPMRAQAPRKQQQQQPKPKPASSVSSNPYVMLSHSTERAPAVRYVGGLSDEQRQHIERVAENRSGRFS